MKKTNREILTILHHKNIAFKNHPDLNQFFKDDIGPVLLGKKASGGNYFDSILLDYNQFKPIYYHKVLRNPEKMLKYFLEFLNDIYDMEYFKGFILCYHRFRADLKIII